MGHALGLALQGRLNDAVALALIIVRFAPPTGSDLPDLPDALLVHPLAPQQKSMATNMASTASHPQNTNLFFRFRQANLPTAARKTTSRKTATIENVSNGMAYFPILAVRSLQKGSDTSLPICCNISGLTRNIACNILLWNEGIRLGHGCTRGSLP